MRLDFNETNILIQTIADLQKNPRTIINKMKIIDTLNALGVRTDKKHTIIRVAVKSLISKIETLSEADITRILEDSRNNNIIASVCYQLPQTSGTGKNSQNANTQQFK